MASQLVYTSAAKLLDAGRSGFGTVARSRSLSPLVVSAIEQVSQFANERGLDRKRVIHCHRRITAGSNRFHLLSRIRDAGSDYTGRTNHIAHHLVVTSEEALRAAAHGLTPADVLRQFEWLSEWTGGPRYFETAGEVALDGFQPDGMSSSRQTWIATTGNPAHARLLAWDSAPRTGVIIAPPTADRLALLAEALAEFGTQSWSKAFTTALETTDELAGLDWIVTTPAGFAEIQPRCGSRTVFDLCHPKTLPVPTVPVVADKTKTGIPAPPPGQQVHQSVPSSATGASSTRPVNVTVATQGATPRVSNPKPAASWKDKKTQYLIGAGVVAMAAIVGLLVLPSGKGEEKSNHETAGQSSAVKRDEGKQDKDTQDKIISKLQPGCITDYDQAEKFAKWVVRKKDSSDWVEIVIDANKEIIKLTDNEMPSDSIPNAFLSKPFPDPPVGCPDWLSKLWNGVNYLSAFYAIKAEDDVNFKIRLQKLDLAVTDLHSASEGLPKLENCDPDLFYYFVKPWIEDAMKNPDKDRLVILFGKESKLWVGGRGILLLNGLKKAASKIDDKQRNSLLEVLKGIKSDLGDKYYQDLVSRIKPADQPVVAKPTVAEPEAPPATGKTPGAVAELLLPKNAPDRQVIIIPKIDELKNGIQIDLLKGIFPSKAEKVQGCKKLNVTAYYSVSSVGGVTSETPKDLNTDVLLLMDDNKNYCESKMKSQEVPKYSNDGKFLLEIEDVTRVVISYAEKKAIIVVDGKNGDFMEAGLTFKLIQTKKPSDDVVVDSEKLYEWIKRIPEEYRKDLTYTVNMKKRKSSEIRGKFPDSSEPSISLPFHQPSGTSNFSEEKSKEVDKKRANVIDELEKLVAAKEKLKNSRKSFNDAKKELMDFLRNDLSNLGATKIKTEGELEKCLENLVPKPTPAPDQKNTEDPTKELQNVLDSISVSLKQKGGHAKGEPENIEVDPKENEMRDDVIAKAKKLGEAMKEEKEKRDSYNSAKKELRNYLLDEKFKLNESEKKIADKQLNIGFGALDPKEPNQKKPEDPAAALKTAVVSIKKKLEEKTWHFEDELKNVESISVTTESGRKLFQATHEQSTKPNP